jgi:parallel beta-helix repeat protein
MQTRLRVAAMALVLLAMSPLPALGSRSGRSSGPSHVVVVDDDRAQCPDANVTTISAAVARVRPDGTIRVCAGTYAAGIVVAKRGVTIESRGGPRLVHVIDTAGAGFGFAVVADRVTVRGFEIAGFGGALEPVAGVEIGGIPQGGGNLARHAARDVAIRGNAIHGALVTGSDADGNLPVDANGVDVDVAGSAHATITGNDLAWSGYGVYGRGARSLRVSDNTIHDQGNWGIITQASTGSRISRNSISRTGEEGVFLDQRSNGGQVRRNLVVDSFQGIVISDSDGVAVIGNTTRANSGYGIALSLAGHASVEGNTASDNDQTGIRIESSRKVAVAGNTAGGNGVRACIEDTEASPCASGIDVAASSGIDVRSNRTDANAGRGIGVRDVTASRFTGNSAHGNGAVDLAWDTLGSNRFHHNACTTALPSRSAWDCH